MPTKSQVDYAFGRLKNDDKETWKKLLEGTVHFDTFPPLRRNPDEKLPVPDLIVVIPVELYAEEFDNVKRVLRLLHRARAGKGYTEVILWFNSIWTEKDPESEDPEADKKADEGHKPEDPEAAKKVTGAPFVYNLWLDRLSGVTVSTDFRLRTIQAWRNHGENFNNIRSDYMDVLIMDPRFSGQADPVVAWIDANTPFMGATALDQAMEAARKKLGWLIKTNLQLTSDVGLSDFSISCMSMAERFAMVYSITRRNLEWNLEATHTRGYVEEPGMVMLLSTYRDSRGIATTDPNVGESRSLVERVKQNLDCTKVPAVYNLRTAPVGKSYRRFVWLAEHGYPLAGSEEGDDYESYSTQVNSNAPLRTDPITIGEVFKTVRRQEYNQINRPDPDTGVLVGIGLEDEQWHRIDAIIHRCGFALAA